MLTYPKSTMRVRRIPMHLSSGHVTLMPEKFYPFPNFPQLDLGRRADSRWALPQISSLFIYFCRLSQQPDRCLLACLSIVHWTRSWLLGHPKRCFYLVYLLRLS